MPVEAKTSMKKPRKTGNHDWFCEAIAGEASGFGVSCIRVHSTARVKTTIPTKAPRVTLAPPRRSASQPPNGRVADPTSAPRKAK